jgi:hypothetical protein
VIAGNRRLHNTGKGKSCQPSASSRARLSPGQTILPQAQPLFPRLQPLSRHQAIYDLAAKEIGGITETDVERLRARFLGALNGVLGL